MKTDSETAAVPLEITGTLKNARRSGAGTDRCSLHGEIYGDTRGRFKDGERVVTSRIRSEDGDIFKTLFSVYKVEFAEGES